LDAIVRAQLRCGGFSDQYGTGPAVFETAYSLLCLTFGRGSRVRASSGKAAAWLVASQCSDGGWPSRPMLRIPLPKTRHPGLVTKWKVGMRGAGNIVRDHRRLFTTAAALMALWEFSNVC
jgi:hypothetical protein